MSVFTNHLILTTSEKGGSGKSTAAIALVDALRFEGIPVAAYDGNVDVSSLYETLGTRDATGRRAPASNTRRSGGGTHRTMPTGRSDGRS